MNTSKTQLEQFLVQNGFTKCGNKFLCRFHDDHRPSGGIYYKPNSKGEVIWYFKCQSCNKGGDIYNLDDMLNGNPEGTAYRKANGKSTNMVTKPEKSLHKCSKTERNKQRIYSREKLASNSEAVYEYWDIKGEKIPMIEVRYGKGKPKPFCSYRPQGDGWVVGFPDVLPIYCGSPAHAKRIRETDTVVIVNGCKTAKALHTIGVVATNRAGGEKSPEKVDWSPLYGKTVVLWADNDPYDEKLKCKPGIKYMTQVKELLSKHCEVKWIDPTRYGLKDKGDAYDWLKSVEDRPIEVKMMPIDEAVSCGASTELFSYLNDIATGKLKNIGWGWPLLASYTQMFIPGTVTFLCGQGGDGKSLFSTQGMQYLHEGGVRWCMYELEDKRNFHLARALAQRVKNSTITSFDEMLGKMEYVKTLESEHKDWADSFGRHIWTLPEEDVTLDSLAKWIEYRAKDGYRVIMVDPITAAEDGELSKWKADKKFIKAAKKTAAEYKCSVLLITHPASGKYSEPSLDGMQGGKALANLCHTAIWLKSADRKKMEDRTVDGKTITAQFIEKVGTAFGTLEFQPINRRMFLNKTRSGKKQDFEIGYLFDPASLTFKEVGMIIKE